MGLAGLGQAEASSITLQDIDREKSRIRICRKKTGELFFVPIYHERELTGYCLLSSKPNKKAKKLAFPSNLNDGAQNNHVISSFEELGGSESLKGESLPETAIVSLSNQKCQSGKVLNTVLL